MNSETGFMSAVDPSVSHRIAETASQVGLLIRYSFYAVGALVFGMIALAFVYGWFNRVHEIDAPPAFRLAASQLARLPVTGHIVTGGKLGRVEVQQYGKLYHRDTDLTAVLIMPPKGTAISREVGKVLRDIQSLRSMRVVFTQNHYDLETRFGDVRAADMRVYTDGRWKLCLSFISRFDSPSVYLTGWYCDASGAKPSAHALACALDRLVLDKPLASKDADAFVRTGMARPANCSAVPVSQTVDTRARTSKNSPAKWSMPAAGARRQQ
jgi:hypothetical protein